MAVPKKKVSKSRRNKRRSHHAIEGLNIVFNKTTGEPQLPHRVSLDGFYNGKKVIVEKEKKNEENESVEAEENKAEEAKPVAEKAKEEKAEKKSVKAVASKKEDKKEKEIDSEKETKE